MTASWIVKLAAAVATIPTVMAHMEMEWPPALRNQHNPFSKEGQIDYSMTAPLKPDGSDFPCKHYHKNTDLTSVATYTPGQKYNLTLAGGAPHNGGSCQVSLSYDGGATFNVIHSIIGGCPLPPSAGGPITYDFTMPADAPAGEALFAWSWSNKVGNREFYMNCAAVTIGGKGHNSRVKRNTKRALNTPRIFVASIAGQGDCAVPEGTDVVYPDPGKSVQYGGTCSSSTQMDEVTAKCSYPGRPGSSGGAPDSGNGSSSGSGPSDGSGGSSDSGNQPPSSGSGGSGGSGGAPPASGGSGSYGSGGSSDSGNPPPSSGSGGSGGSGGSNDSGSPPPASGDGSSSGSGSAPPSSGSGSPGGSGPSDGSGGSGGSGSYPDVPTPGAGASGSTNVGTPAPGDGNSSTAPPAPGNGNSSTAPPAGPSYGSGSAGSCPTDGAIVCNDPSGMTWSMCDHGQLTSMGSVAAGMKCEGNQMVPVGDASSAPPATGTGGSGSYKVRRGRMWRGIL